MVSILVITVCNLDTANPLSPFIYTSPESSPRLFRETKLQYASSMQHVYDVNISGVSKLPVSEEVEVYLSSCRKI